MINTFRTLFEARERKFQQERLFRGESVDLVARITTDGVMDTLSDYSISGVYQPVGDDPEGLTYTLDAEISDGKAILHWTDENDFGKTAYNVWGLLTKDGKAAYPIAWRLNFANSPSYPIDEINPLVRTIDFDKYDLLNAPWLPLSGGNMEEGADIGFPISGDTYFTVSKDGFKKVDETTVETEAMSGYCWHELPDPVPEYEIQWLTESQIADWDPSTQGTPPWQDPRYRLCGTKPAESHTEKTTIASFSVPSDEEGEHTFATREWTESELSDYSTKTEADGKYLALSGGNITMDFNLKCVGFNVLSGLTGAIAIGTASSSTGFSTVVGHHAKADARYSVVLGNEAKSTAQNGVAIGDSAQALSVDSTAVGALAYATKANSLALGKSAKANASKAIQLGIGVNALENSLQVFDKNVLSGSNLTVNPDRIPYLSSYATQEWVNEQISSIPQPTPPMPSGILTIKQNETTVAEYNPDDGTNLTATIYVPIVPTDLSDFTNSPGYATETWVDEQIDELSSVYVKKKDIDFLSTDWAGMPDMNQVSLFDIAHRLNFCIQAISGKEIPRGSAPSDMTYTYVEMEDGTILSASSVDLNDIQEGTMNAYVQQQGYSGSNKIKGIVLGAGVTNIGHHAFAGFEKLESVDISRATSLTLVEDRTFQYDPMLSFVDLGTTITTIGATVFQHSYNLKTLTIPASMTSANIWSFNNGGIETMVFTDRTKAEVQAMSSYPWQMGGCLMVATDESWTA